MDSYTRQKIQAAISQAGGNPTQTHRLLMDWLQNDDRLLRGLSGPFINGIVAHAIQKASGGRVRPQASAAPKTPRKMLPPGELSKVLARMGRGGSEEPAPQSVAEVLSGEPKKLADTGTDHKHALKDIAAAFKR
jgi:hypothetical protein